MRRDSPMVIDCQTCPVREVRCDECIVTALGGLPLAMHLPNADTQQSFLHSMNDTVDHFNGSLLPS